MRSFLFNRHSERKDFVCHECGKPFKRKDKMKEHVKRMHSEERKLKQKQLQKLGAVAVAAAAAGTSRQAPAIERPINGEQNMSKVMKISTNFFFCL